MPHQELCKEINRQFSQPTVLQCLISRLSASSTQESCPDQDFGSFPLEQVHSKLRMAASSNCHTTCPAQERPFNRHQTRPSVRHVFRCILAGTNTEQAALAPSPKEGNQCKALLSSAGLDLHSSAGCHRRSASTGQRSSGKLWRCTSSVQQRCPIKLLAAGYSERSPFSLVLSAFHSSALLTIEKRNNLN